MSRIALKRLTASDLTFFEVQFRTIGAGNQKSINLNRDVFIDRLYPGLARSISGTRYPVDLNILGPEGKPRHNLQRKILGGGGTYKNYRLNGEFVYGPDDDPDRYAILAPDDLALIEFEGDLAPEAVKIALVSSKSSVDRNLYGYLNSLLNGKSMAEVSRAGLANAAEMSEISPEHSFWIVTDADGPLDSSAPYEAITNSTGAARVRPKVTKTQLFARSRDLRSLGDSGEYLVNEYLESMQTAGTISDLQWISIDDAYAPLDFTFRSDSAHEVKIDVKTTTGGHDVMFYLSLGELREAVEAQEYCIYRVSQFTENPRNRTAILRTAYISREWAEKLLSCHEALPAGVTSPTFGIQPSILNFSEAIHLAQEVD